MTDSKDTTIDLVESAQYSLLIGLTISDGLLFLILLVMIFYKLKYQETSSNLWIQITLLFLSSVAFIILDYFEWRQYLPHGEDQDKSQMVTMFTIAGILLYMMQHWIFTISYFSVAINFRFIFSSDQVEA